MSQNYKLYCQWRRKCKNSHREIPVPEAIRKLEFLVSFALGYEYFGDIFNLKFEEWWESNGKISLDRKKLRTVIDFRDIVDNEIEMAITSFKLINSRKPTLEEFKQYFITLLDNPKKMIFAIDLKHEVSFDNIIEQLKKIISQPKVRPSVWKYPITKVRDDELRRYLDVYTLRKSKNSMPDIAKKIDHYSRHESSTADIHRMILSDYKKAEKILRNVESGVFPGRY